MSLPTHPSLTLAPLIGLCGLAGSGKDAACKLLMAARPGKIQRFALADALKRQVAAASGVTVEALESKKSIFRPTLQAFGVLRRELNGVDYWVRRVEGEVATARRSGKVACLTDIRFNTEVGWLRENQGILVRVVRPSFGKIAPDHVSEFEQASFSADFTLEAGNLVELQGEVDRLLAELRL